jgi:4-hydroxybenzoate polyprenyltransferase
MNIAYCVKLKQKAIVDVFIIAIGFVLRILMGGFATGIYISHWIILMTFLLALFLAFAKRRDDVVMYENTGVKARKNVDRYNLDFMNQAIGIVASVTMVCYIMYTVSEDVILRLDSHYVYVTSIFVLAGIIRYLQVTIVDVKSGSPTKVLMKDRFIQACVAGWMITFALILYC